VDPRSARGESRDISWSVTIHICRVCFALGEDPASVRVFPQQGGVELTRDDEGEMWGEVWWIA
jgi:hypothetical protein